jgi:Ca2+/H+ antiporter, TMEM165/GDT1 family
VGERERVELAADEISDAVGGQLFEPNGAGDASAMTLGQAHESCYGRPRVVATFFLVYSTVAIAEVLGDKTLYTLSALATRFRLAPIVLGAALAFSLKMAAAILLGHFIASLPPWLVTWVSAATFFAMAVATFYGIFKSKPAASPLPSPRFAPAVVTTFLALFIPEWGDPGQIAAALLVGQGVSPLLVWCAGTLAMLTKAALAIALGLQLRRFVPEATVRMASAIVFTLLGVLVITQVGI